MDEFNYQLFFQEVALRIHSNLNINEAIKSTFEYIKQFIPVDAIGLYYMGAGADQGDIFSVAHYGKKVFPTSDSPFQPAMSLPKSFFDAIEKHESRVKQDGIVYDDSTQLPLDLLEHLPFLKNYSMLGMDLDVDTSDKNRLMLLKEGRGVYTKKHADIIRSVKVPFEIAISNARTYIDLLKLKNTLAEENSEMKTQLGGMIKSEIVGVHSGLRKVMEAVEIVANMVTPILLLGETGTGKGVIANHIHKLSNRCDKPFVKVQCGSISDDLLDSELFGHEKGSFTGAISSRRGRFERAEGGTIFLDEIGELSPSAQVKLLGVLQEKEFERVGGSKVKNADVRVIAATHRDLPKMVQKGEFREDLWFRLNVFPIVLPPLKDRKEDIPLLADYFIRKKMKELNIVKQPKAELFEMKKFMEYDWPGNIREMENAIERTLIVSQNKLLKVPDFNYNPVDTEDKNEQTDTEIIHLDVLIKQYLLKALKKTNGRIEGSGGAAELLGMNPSTLRGKLRSFNIPFGKKYRG